MNNVYNECIFLRRILRWLVGKWHVFGEVNFASRIRSYLNTLRFSRFPVQLLIVLQFKFYLACTATFVYF